MYEIFTNNFRFLKECGRDLQTLYMSSCKFVNGEVIIAVAENCLKLKGTKMLNFMISIYSCLLLFRFFFFVIMIFKRNMNCIICYLKIESK